MERHVKVARAHRAISWLYALITILFFLVLLLPQSSEPSPVFAVMLLFFGGLFTLHYFTANGAFGKKTWAKYSSRIIAILLLFGFPIGTLIGIYLLYNSRGWSTEQVTHNVDASLIWLCILA